MTKAHSNILVVDVGGNHVKLLCTGQSDPVKIPSGPEMTARQMAEDVKKAAKCKYTAVSIGYPGPVFHNQPVAEPHNLGGGWVGFDYAKAFGTPVRILNDAAMQALGSYEGGRMLFLGLGTGLGSAMIVDGRMEPMELAHLPYKKGHTYEDYVGQRGLERMGKKKWRKAVADVVERLKTALGAEYVVLGGGNSRLIDDLPEGVRRGDNANAFEGGFRMWQGDSTRKISVPRKSAPAATRARSRKKAAAPASAAVPEESGVNPEITIVADNQTLFRAAADQFLTAASDAIRTKGGFDVVLSGGSTPKGLFTLLAGDTSFPWDQVRFFWGDERHVPPDHPDSNYRMANEALLLKIGAKPEQVWRMAGENPNAAEAANDYERQLHKYFATAPGQFPKFDLVLLGMGPDGHTASLFPGTKALDARDRLVVSNWVGKFYTDRITFTAPLLNAAATVMFMISGSDKAPALKGVLEGPYEPLQLPSQLIRPENGRLVWLIERTAGGMLKGT